MTDECEQANIKEDDERQKLSLTRRGMVAAGIAGLAATGAASAQQGPSEQSNRPFAPEDHDHSGERGSTSQLGVASPVESIDVETITAAMAAVADLNDVRHVHAADWDDQLQNEIDSAAANDERQVVVHGKGTFEPRTTVYLPDNFTLKIDDNVQLVPPADHNLDGILTGERTYRSLITNADHENGNENVAIEGGYISFENVEWEEMSHAAVWFHNCVEPRQEGVTVENVLYDYGSEGNTRQFGVYISESENGLQRECVARRVGYDGIANRASEAGGRMIHCEAYDIPGTGIQFAGDVRGDETTEDHPYPDEFVIRGCKTDNYITIHSNGEGVTDGIVESNEARYISLIGDAQIDNVEFINNISTAGLLLSPRDEMTNIRVHGHDFRSSSGSSIRMYGYGFAPETHLDTLTISGCFSRGSALLSSSKVGTEDAVYENVRLINNVHNPEDAEGTAFFDGGGEADVEALDVIGNTVHAPTVIDGGADTVRLQDNTLNNVDEIATDGVSRLLQNGRGTNIGDPSVEGEWNGYTDFAERSNALIHDTENDDWYRAVDGEWVKG